MKKQMKNSQRTFGRSIIFSCVFLVLGFILAFSFSLSKTEESGEGFTGGAFFAEEDRLLEEYIRHQEENKSLREELLGKQEQVRLFEKDFAESEAYFLNYTEEAEALRRFLGVKAIEGEGLRLTLQDGDYSTKSVNPNDYIVHESHVFQVINELYISGAQAISVNGQRLNSNSTIVCTGPVITVDGNQFPAPFIIEAIGDSDVLASSLKLSGGVLDQLVNDNIVIILDEGNIVSMPALLTES
ncbi:MAG TPA: DUF881 domain-containing protein [Planococcus sp. (in: firmicutes)]|nr:DUF881 domain-containing protein [Planococcus sp. (in: firmicutes)]